MDVKEQAAVVLRMVRFLWAFVRERGRREWRGPVWVQVSDAQRPGYAFDNKAGAWYCPGRWKPAPEYSTGRLAV
jgi:hypothetical protein